MCIFHTFVILAIKLKIQIKTGTSYKIVPVNKGVLNLIIFYFEEANFTFHFIGHFA